MSNLRVSEQSQVQRVIRGDCAASPTKAAGSAQCHPLDEARNRVDTCPEKGVVHALTEPRVASVLKLFGLVRDRKHWYWRAWVLSKPPLKTPVLHTWG
jgi:hypothetical protein